MLCVSRLFYSFSLMMLAFALGAGSARAQIDLHAHLHMKPGLGLFLQGNFDEEPKANNWSDRIYTKVSATSLAEMTNETRPKLIVLSLYAHPYLSYSFSRDGFHFDRKENVRKAIEQEYQEFSKFVATHSDHFAFARSASEARSILKKGKTVIVLSLEGAWGTLGSPEDHQLWIDERGLAIVTPVHLTPDSLGGNALMNALVSFTNSTADFLSSVWKTRGSCLKTFCKSDEGFTNEGVVEIDELIKENVWLDLAHANEKEVSTIIEMYEAGIGNTGPLPLLITHTQLRDFYPVERGLGSLEINYIRKHDGIVGIIPSQFMMPGALKNPEQFNPSSTVQTQSCISGLDIFKKTIAYAIATLGDPNRVTLASDINAPLDGLSPACGEPSSTSTDLQRRGYYTYSQWNALTNYVTPDVSGNPKTTWADQSLEHFLTLWAKVRP